MAAAVVFIVVFHEQRRKLINHSWLSKLWVFIFSTENKKCYGPNWENVCEIQLGKGRVTASENARLHADDQQDDTLHASAWKFLNY